MSIESIGALVASVAGPAGAGPTSGRAFDLLPPGEAGLSPRLEGRFEAALERAGGIEATVPAGPIPPALKGMFNALDQVNVQARSVSRYAQAAEASGGQLTPGEMVQLTMKCSEFMFQAQLTSNIANRSSDGVQQLFKQQ
ncbi:MAG: hypothetical protein J7500_11845 [Sphingomonas sp.]|uniref:hypothetical protein n=1 Tax=Sphingomonas sp. TaxID=28214 RepID=UPI001B133F00|nr:hypothetical protein [Sphingomonas sp.]MBO9623392.1 hypothetical protein [Sphingomonas sp.]